MSWGFGFGEHLMWRAVKCRGDSDLENAQTAYKLHLCSACGKYTADILVI